MFMEDEGHKMEKCSAFRLYFLIARGPYLLPCNKYMHICLCLRNVLDLKTFHCFFYNIAFSAIFLSMLSFLC